MEIIDPALHPDSSGLLSSPAVIISDALFNAVARSLMDHYYPKTIIRKGGVHEVHLQERERLPTILGRTYVGIFGHCHMALKDARSRGYERVEACPECLEACDQT